MDSLQQTIAVQTTESISEEYDYGSPSEEEFQVLEKYGTPSEEELRRMEEGY